MVIPKDVLVNWAKPGKNEISKQTYSALKEVITKNVECTNVRLQGSYSNSTNVRDNSDIDILVMCKGYSPDIGGHKSIAGLKQHVYNSINGKNGYKFTMGNKTIKHNGGSGKVPADIIPCVECIYGGKSGIAIYDSSNQNVIFNYPILHQKNGEAKSDRTNGNYKKAIRMFKNARNQLVKDNRLSEGCAPSYFIECLMYNVPDDEFKGSEFDIFHNSLVWIRNTNINNTICQNGVTNIFGSESTQWNIENFRMFKNALVLQWDEWRQ